MGDILFFESKIFQTKISDTKKVHNQQDVY